MVLNQKIIDNSDYNVNEKVKFSNLEEHSYLYPNGHRITHQLRWLKYSRDIVSSENIVT